MNLPDYFYEFEGDLYDRRFGPEPVRENYCFHHAQIDTLADLKATLRAGPYAWPGGYPLYLVTADGGALSFDAVRDCWREVVGDFLDGIASGWRVCGCVVNFEDRELLCDHTGERIECAYED